MSLTKLHLALFLGMTFFSVGCSHRGGCYDPSTGLVHSGPCGLFDTCGTGICLKKSKCKCRSCCKHSCRSCNPCETLTPAYGGAIDGGIGCPSCEPYMEGQQVYPELMVPHGSEYTVPQQVVPAPAAEDQPDSQTYLPPVPSEGPGLSIPPVSYSSGSSMQPAIHTVPIMETSAF